MVLMVQPRRKSILSLIVCLFYFRCARANGSVAASSSTEIGVQRANDLFVHYFVFHFIVLVFVHFEALAFYGHTFIFPAPVE